MFLKNIHALFHYFNTNTRSFTVANTTNMHSFIIAAKTNVHLFSMAATRTSLCVIHSMTSLSRSPTCCLTAAGADLLLAGVELLPHALGGLRQQLLALLAPLLLLPLATPRAPAPRRAVRVA